MKVAVTILTGLLSLGIAATNAAPGKGSRARSSAETAALSRPAAFDRHDSAQALDLIWDDGGLFSLALSTDGQTLSGTSKSGQNVILNRKH
jgi:hypothetical protein